MFGNFGLQCCPVMKVGGSDIPHVILKDSLGDWRTLISLICSNLFRQLTTGLQC